MIMVVGRAVLRVQCGGTATNQHRIGNASLQFGSGFQHPTQAWLKPGQVNVVGGLLRARFQRRCGTRAVGGAA